MGSQLTKLDDDLRTLLSIRYDHYYCPYSLEEGGRLAPMSVDLVDRVVNLVAVMQFDVPQAWVWQTLAL
jgi:hypothetical protein